MQAHGSVRHYLLRYRAQLLLGLLCVIAGNGLALVGPAVLRRAIDDLSAGLPQGTSALVGYALLIVLLALGDGAARCAARLLINRVSRRVEYEMRNDLFTHVERLDQRFFHEMRTGDLVARFTNDLSAVRQSLGAGIQQIFGTIVLFTAILALMLSISPKLTAFTFLILPSLGLIYWLLKQQIEDRFRAVQDQFAALSTQVQENLSGIRVVKAYAQEEAEIAALREASAEYVARNIAEIRISGIVWPLMSFVGGLAIVSLIYFGGQEVIAGHLTLGEFVQFSVYLAMLSWPMIALGWVANLYNQARAALARLSEVFGAEPAIHDPPAPVRGQPIQGEVELRHVTFSYADRPVLRDFSLRIPRGKTVALVGPMGAGKSTVAQLIPRVYDPDAGQVLVDGIDVRERAVAELRAAIGYVPQETFLFSDTLRANVALGVDDADDAAIADAVRIAGLATDVADFPEGIDTLVGERGVTLSGGQKQRTAIARALLKDPPILILDDALSSVDVATEEAILQALRDVTRSRTCLIISHRISTIRHADQIVVVEDGTIAEQGSHAELLVHGGLYARLYRQQLLASELDGDELTAVSGQPSAVSGQPSAVSGQPSGNGGGPREAVAPDNDATRRDGDARSVGNSTLIADG